MSVPFWFVMTSLAIASGAALFSFIWKSDEDFYGIDEFKDFQEALKRGKR